MVEPCIVKAYEDPLGPFEIFWIGGIDFLIPVITEAEFFYLSSESITILVGSH